LTSIRAGALIASKQGSRVRVTRARFVWVVATVLIVMLGTGVAPASAGSGLEVTGEVECDGLGGASITWTAVIYGDAAPEGSAASSGGVNYALFRFSGVVSGVGAGPVSFDPREVIRSSAEPVRPIVTHATSRARAAGTATIEVTMEAALAPDPPRVAAVASTSVDVPDCGSPGTTAPGEAPQQTTTSASPTAVSAAAVRPSFTG